MAFEVSDGAKTDTATFKVEVTSAQETLSSLEKAIGGINPMLGCFIPVKSPHLVMDTSDPSSATVLGLLHAQEGTADGKGTAEVSFFTPIPGSAISAV